MSFTSSDEMASPSGIRVGDGERAQIINFTFIEVVGAYFFFHAHSHCDYD